MNGLEQVLPFVLIAVVFWLLLIRPQRRRQMQLASTQRSIQVGDEVLLGAGIVGVVATAEDEYLHLEISPGVLMKVARQAVVRVLTEHHPGGATDADSAGPLDSAPDVDPGPSSPDRNGPDGTGPDGETPPRTQGA